MQGWMLSVKNIDQYRNYSRTYKKEKTALADAADLIKGWAEYEIENIMVSKDQEERKEDLERFQNMVNLVKKKKHKEAYEEWRDYSREMQPDDDVMIEDTEIVED
jgi:hypothetical protein